MAIPGGFVPSERDGPSNELAKPNEWHLDCTPNEREQDCAEHFNLKTEMAEGESAAVIGPTRLPASRVASSYRCNHCEPGSLVEPSTTPSSSLSIPVSRFKNDAHGSFVGESRNLKFWGADGRLFLGLRDFGCCEQATVKMIA
jgi:hypothetical protein